MLKGMNKIGIWEVKAVFQNKLPSLLRKNDLKDFRVKHLTNSESVLKEVENSKETWYFCNGNARCSD